MDRPFYGWRKANKVNYKITSVDNPQKSRVAHINDLKPYNVESPVCTLQVMADYFPRVPNIFLSHEIADIQPQIQEILDQYTDLVNETPGTTHVVHARIDTEEGKLVSLPPYRIPEAKRDQVKREIEKLIEQGILERHASRWSSPMVTVNKPDGSIRICGNYHQLNQITPQWHAHMPVLAEILEKIGRSRALSKLDLNKGFHQVPLDPETMDKTAIVTPLGRYRCTKMPFGIKNTPAVF